MNIIPLHYVETIIFWIKIVEEEYNPTKGPYDKSKLERDFGSKI